MKLRLLLIYMLFYSFSVLAKNTTIVCTHPQVCNLVSPLLDLTKVDLKVGVTPEADPHAHEIGPKEIKNLIKADIVLAPGTELQHWLHSIEKRRKRPTFIYRPTHHKKSHFWLYPNEICKAYNYFAKALEKTIKLKKNDSFCEKLNLQSKAKIALKKLQNKTIILTHDAAEQLLLDNNIKVLSLKGSGHHDEVDINALKKLSKLQKSKKSKEIVWVIEKGIHIPSTIMSRIRKDELIIKVDILGTLNHKPFQVINTLLESINKVSK